MAFHWLLYPISFFTIILGGIFLSQLFLGNCYGSGVPAHTKNSCTAYIAQYEKQHQIPKGLLHAVSKVESGRKDATGRIVAWPWTINAAGQGYYFPTKEAAISAVLDLQSKGIQSIDIGCMQVNLYHHPKAFKNLNDAFDPAQNVAYAARFLTALKHEHFSWQTAVAHYHSANPIHHIPYQKTVFDMWKNDTQKGGISLAAGVFDSFSTQSSPTVNRIRRLTTLKTLSLKSYKTTKPASKGCVRRVIRGNSPHIHRI